MKRPSPLLGASLEAADPTVTGRWAWLSRHAVDISLGLVFVALMFGATSPGLVVGQRDAPSYLAMGESIAAGSGIQAPFGDPGQTLGNQPVTNAPHFPPGYPILLSVGVKAGLTPIDAARVAAVVTVALVAVIVAIYCRHRGLGRHWCAVGGSLAGLLVAPYGLGPLAEPLYMLALLGVMFALARFMSRPTLPHLTLAALLAGASFGVRYIGLALVGTVAIIALLPPASLRQRLTRASTAVLASAAPASLILIATASADPRRLGWYPLNATDIKILVNTLAGVLIPPVGSPSIRTAAAGLVTLTAVIAVLWVRGEDHFRSGPTLTVAPGLVSAVLHVSALASTRLLFSYQAHFSARLLLPAVLSLLIAGIDVAAARSDGSQRDRRMAGAIFLLSSLALVAAGWAASIAASGLADGERGFLEPVLTQSEVIARAVSETGPLLSNVPDGMWVLGRAGVWSIPTEFNSLNQEPNHQLQVEMDFVTDLVDRRGAKILYLRSHERDYLIDETALRTLAPCELAADEVAVLLGGAHACD